MPDTKEAALQKVALTSSAKSRVMMVYVEIVFLELVESIGPTGIIRFLSTCDFVVQGTKNRRYSFLQTVIVV